MSNARAKFDKQDSIITDDLPQGSDTVDDRYTSRADEEVPVLKDEDPVEQPNDAEDPDSDETLGMLHRHSVSRSFHFPNSKILDAELGFRGYICLFLESPRGL
jgi:hypothetical protein